MTQPILGKDYLPDPTAGEVWLPVVGFEGRYEVSHHGRVRSIDHQAPASWIDPRDGKVKNTYMPVRGKILKPQKQSSGHVHVSLGRRNLRRIHTIVLDAFVCLRPDGMEGCHEDGNPANCHLENLRWDTHENNLKDMDRHGTRARGSDFSHCKMTEDRVIQAMALRGKMTAREIGEMFGVSPWVIHAIHQGRTWKHLTRIQHAS